MADEGNNRLNSWKDIAAYLNCNEATARRWEKESGLPVYRPGGTKSRSVYAFPSEIDAWLRGGRQRRAATPLLIDAVHSGPQPEPAKGGLLQESPSRPSVPAEQPAQSTPVPEHLPHKHSRFSWRYFLYGSIATIILVVMLGALYGQLAKPTIDSIDPQTPRPHNRDQAVWVHGSNFKNDFSITVHYPGGVSMLSGTQIQHVRKDAFQMIILLGIKGTYSITINNPDGIRSNEFKFQVIEPGVT